MALCLDDRPFHPAGLKKCSRERFFLAVVPATGAESSRLRAGRSMRMFFFRCFVHEIDADHGGNSGFQNLQDNGLSSVPDR